MEAGGTGIVLRKAAALAPAAVGRRAAAGGRRRPARRRAAPRGRPGAAPAAAGAPRPPLAPPSWRPLTGIFYASPTPGSPPFVEVGREVVVGQVIGLIEAMKLFNEIKSDKAGRVVRVVPENGTLVKAKQPLIEVEPL